MDNKKHIVNLESFREMLHICPRLPHQPFVEPPFEEEILVFLHFLRHSAVIKKLTDVNINKLHQPWRAFASIINKCLTEKSSGYDSVEHKDTKKSNEMYYPRFMKVIIHHLMSKNPSIPMRNKFGALLPIKLTNEDIRNSNAYKEYYVVATGATPPKPKASVWKTRSSSDTTVTPPTTATGPRLTTFEKGKQAAKASKAKSLSALSEAAMTEAQQLKLNSTDEEGDDDEGKDGDGDDDDQEDERMMKRMKDEESFDPIPKTPKNSDDEGNGEEDLDLNVGREEGHDEEEEEDELYRDVNINQGRGIQTTQEIEDSHVTLTLVNPDDIKGKEPESASAPQETATKSVGMSTQGSQSRQMSVSESAAAEEPMQTTFEMKEPSHPEFETGADDQPIVESSHHPEWFSQKQKPPTPYHDWNKTLLATHGSIQPWISELMKQYDSCSFFNKLMDTLVDFSNFLINRLKVDTLTPELLAAPTYELLKGSAKESARDVYSKRRIIVVTELKIVEWRKLTNLTVEERFAFNVSLGVESYHKKLNLTKSDINRSDLKHREAYIAYSNPRGFIYQNKDKKNMLMRIDELHKFSDGTLTDVRTALDDHLKRIRM
nr:hypothetical protein [Tanacetum cinerariifolium]